eukprot:m.194642 g.194642  ORF g.194642 m.194642 type:complete len:95 (+) comp18655_c0_seq2:1484-1768(+)
MAMADLVRCVILLIWSWFGYPRNHSYEICVGSCMSLRHSKICKTFSAIAVFYFFVVGRTSINTTLDAKSVHADVMDTIFFEDELQADGYYDDIE